MSGVAPSHESLVKYEAAGSDGVGTLLLCDERSHNVLSDATLAAIAAGLELAMADAQARVLLVAAEGRAFSVGAQLQELAVLGSERTAEFVARGQRVFHALAGFPNPTIAAVSGLALGGGLELALSCDIRWASSNASFGFPEIYQDLCPAWGGVRLLAESMSAAWRSDLLLTGRLVSAQRACEIGIVSRVFGARTFATQVAKHARALSNQRAEVLKSFKRLLRGRTTEAESLQELLRLRQTNARSQQGIS